MPCTPPTTSIYISPTETITISTSDYENAQKLLEEVSGDGGDPTNDGYDESVASGNNDGGSTGVQTGKVTQTNLPPPILEEAKSMYAEPPPFSNGKVVTPGQWMGDYDLPISEHYTVKNFTIGAFFPNQIIDLPDYNLNIQDRVNNLTALAVNVVEPLLARFGNVRINSALRNNNTTKNGVSQHVAGQAVDIQIIGWVYDQYWENAQWVKDNIPFDQFIFEHSDKTASAWYHLSFKASGNRPSNDKTKVMTMYRNQYSPGLLQFY